MSAPDPFRRGDVAFGIADVGLITDASETGALERLTRLASHSVSGCVGATAARWATGDRPEPLECVSSHPDLAHLADIQCARCDGPMFDAARDRSAIVCNDTLVETRWPGFAAEALRAGVRCFAATARREGAVLVTLTLYGVLPGALDQRQLGIGELLAAQGGAAVSNTSRYDDAHRTAVQLQQAVEARAVVDQAKGIIMHALGCDAERAFGELRRISQTRHVKLTALAQRIVAAHGLPGDSRNRTTHSSGSV